MKEIQAVPVEPQKGQRQQYVTRLSHARNILLSAIFAALTPTAHAQDIVAADCLRFDQGEQKPGRPFPFTSWLNRGLCVRKGNYEQCRTNLITVLEGLNPILSTEYNAAATVLVLLPTIGAFFGAPTNELWILFAIMPFGGGLATLLSFGGTTMSSKLDDYQAVLPKHTLLVGQKIERDLLETPAWETSDSEIDEEGLSAELSVVTGRITNKMCSKNRPEGSRSMVIAGLVVMGLLLCGAQIAMGIVEAGSVYSNGCEYNWWFHMWYIVVTLATCLDNWAQLPFTNSTKIYISSIPYDIKVTGGEQINDNFKHDISTSTGPKQNLHHSTIQRLQTLQGGNLKIVGSRLYTPPSNSMLIMVSTARNSSYDSQATWRFAFQIFAKAASVTVFVFGTCVLAAVTLLAMPMAQMVAMLILAAGLGSRTVARGITARYSQSGSLLHVISASEKQTLGVIFEIFKLQRELARRAEGGEAKRAGFQVEIGGHVFVDGRRVARRSAWYRSIFGVLARPFELRDMEYRSEEELLEHSETS